jgi:hypothetical protein
MARWTPEEQLTFDIAFGLKKVTIPGFRKALKRRLASLLPGDCRTPQTLSVGVLKTFRANAISSPVNY